MTVFFTLICILTMRSWFIGMSTSSYPSKKLIKSQKEIYLSLSKEEQRK